MPVTKLQRKRTSMDKAAHDRLTMHEKICAERHDHINTKMEVILLKIEKLSKAHAWIGGGLALLFVLFNLGFIDLSSVTKHRMDAQAAEIGK